MTEVPSLEPFAEAVRDAINRDVFKYDQGLAAWRQQADELIRAGDYVFHSVGEDVVVPAVADMVIHAGNNDIKSVALIAGLAVQTVIDLEHERKQLLAIISLFRTGLEE